jgi:hypothetical protein
LHHGFSVRTRTIVMPDDKNDPVTVFNDAYWRGWCACRAWKDAEYDAMMVAYENGMSVLAKQLMEVRNAV